MLSTGSGFGMGSGSFVCRLSAADNPRGRPETVSTPFLPSPLRGERVRVRGPCRRLFLRDPHPNPLPEREGERNGTEVGLAGAAAGGTVEPVGRLPAGRCGRYLVGLPGRRGEAAPHRGPAAGRPGQRADGGGVPRAHPGACYRTTRPAPDPHARLLARR